MKAKIDRDWLENHTMPGGTFRALAHLFKGLEGRLLGAAVAYLIKHSPVWVAPIVTAEIINLLVARDQASWPIILAMALGLFLILLQNIPMNTLYARLLNGSIRTMESRTRMALIRRFQVLSLAYHGETRTGALQNKVLRDVEGIGIMVTHGINTVLSTLVTIIIAMTWTLAKTPWMALFFVLSIPVATGLVRVFRRPIADNTQDYRKALEGMTVRVTEALEMLPVTRAHGTEDHELRQLEERMTRVADSGRRLDVLNGLFGASSWVMFQVFSLVNLLVAGYLALSGMIPVGDVVLYQGFFGSIIGGINGIINIMPDLAKGSNAIKSLGEVLHSTEVEDYSGKTPVPTVEGDFRFESVYFAYPGSSREVLQNITLHVPRGATVALVGESGSGKSTLINQVIGFYKPSRGQVFLDGVDMATLDLRDYRKHLAVVSQNVLLFSGTIRDNITYGLGSVPEEEVVKALEAANASRFVDELPQGLDTLLGEHGSKLSGGQRQRIAIARALVRNPRVLILDEATSALDVESERLVQEAIDTMIRGRTTFIVAHRLSTIRNASLVAVMEEGRIIELGSYQDLAKANGAFSRLTSHYRT